MVKGDSKRILLIEPPFCRLYKDTYSLDMFPLSLGFLGASIKKNTDWDVLLYNADFNPASEIVKLTFLTGEGFTNYKKNLNDLSGKVWNEIRNVIIEYNPSVVGITVKTQNFKSACNVANIVKNISDKIIVIMGGPHPSMVGGEILKNSEIDICVVGEGELTIVEILSAIENGKEYNEISGIVFRKDNSIISNQKRDLIDDLDSLDFPFKYATKILYNFQSYPKRAFAHIFATRGCPYNCTFCGSKYIWTRKVRYRSVDNVIEEIKAIQRYGVNYIRFDDDTFGVNKKYLTALCEALSKNCPGLSWECEMNVQLVSQENISLMKSAGCRMIQVGIESGNNEILSLINKNITIERALEACRIIKQNKVILSVFFIIGFPQETEKTLNDTISVIKKIKCDSVSYSIFTPYPGTEIFNMCKNMGLIDESYDYSLYNHQSPDNHFCVNIKHDQFRMIAGKIERTIEIRNTLGKYKNIFSAHVFMIIREYGIIGSLKKMVQSIRVVVGNE